MGKHIYCISGLGADFRIFSKLEIPGAILHPIGWEMPNQQDDMCSFAAKLSKQIQHPNPILLGVSFGGMLTTEIAKIVPIEKAIIVSSCKTRKELPWYMRSAGKVGLHKVVPYGLITQNQLLSRFIFDTRSRQEELYLKQMMLKQTQAEFIKRSVDMIVNWQNSNYPENLCHIHGSTDKLLLPGFIKPHYWVKGGGHFMIWNRADEVSRLIQQELLGYKNGV
jgi:pimeloyl-ACP methyl ester carboxylesterase